MRRVDGATVTRLTLGGLRACPWLAAPQGAVMGAQKSAEAVVAAAHGGDGPNMRRRTGAEHSMREGDAARRAGRPEGPRRVGGGTAERTGIERQARTACDDPAGDGPPLLLEEVWRRENLLAAHRRVVQNGGAPGVDGMTVDELMPYCRAHWARLREELLSETYAPQPVRRVEIPKPDGQGRRPLGIPTVISYCPSVSRC